MLGSPAGPGGASQRGLWPLAPAPAPPASGFAAAADGFNRYGVYSLFSGGPNIGGALYSHASAIGRFAASGISPTSGAPFHSATHKESIFSSSGCYTFGSPTSPPGSPYSPVASATQLELLNKSYTCGVPSNSATSTSGLVLRQSSDYPQPAASPKKFHDVVKSRTEEKCCYQLLQSSSSAVKSEKCGCPHSHDVSGKFGKFSPGGVVVGGESSGCSRTNPIEWNLVSVKREPVSSSTPCQVPEITTSLSPSSEVKIEVTSPSSYANKAGCGGVVDVHSAPGGGVATALLPTVTSMPSIVATTNGNNIPVGIAVARQRVQHQEIASSPSLPPAGLLTTVNSSAQLKEYSRLSTDLAGMAASATTGGVATGGALLQCTDDRATGLAAWTVGGSHGSAIATPTLWQYPALPMEPIPLPVPVPPVGVQLVRDPSSGHLLLLPTTGIEQVQQAVVWPSYHQPPSLYLPPLPPPPLQLLSSASSDYLSSSTTLHQHTQTHNSTRLLTVTTTDTTKRKLPLPIPATTLIKIETDASTGGSAPVTASALEHQTKALQTIGGSTGTVFGDQSMAPLVTTHVIYQTPTNLILSSGGNAGNQQQQQQTIDAVLPPPSSRSQATSPVAVCLSPPLEATIASSNDEEPIVPCVQDASNQTDTPICSEDDNTTPICDPPLVVETKLKLQDLQQECAVSESSNIAEVPPPQPVEVPSLPEPATQPSVQQVFEERTQPEWSGLELLSNSIEEYEKTRVSASECRFDISNDLEEETQYQTLLPIHNIKKEVQTTESEVDENGARTSMDDCSVEKLGGLDLLCALAEQRFIEEVKNGSSKREHREKRREKRKSHRHSEEYSSRKKLKSEYKKHREEEKRNRRDLEFAKRTHMPDENDSSPFDTVVSRNDETLSGHRTYKSRESEEEVRKFLASKSQSGTHSKMMEWPEMNASELDMRMKLADLQRKYKEKQRELHMLKPKRKSSEEKSSRKRKSRKKSAHSEKSTTPPPLLDKIVDVPTTPIRYELLKPPTLCAINNNHHTERAYPKSSTIVADSPGEQRSYYYSPGFEDQVADCSSPEKIPSTSSSCQSSSKKRKVGRPKKRVSENDQRTVTETIVAKKLKSGNLVGYLFAAKQKMQQRSPVYTNNSSFFEDVSPIRKPKVRKTESASKIRPKLKAEPTVRTDFEDDDVQSDWEADNVVLQTRMEEEVEEEEEEEEDEEVDEPVVEPLNAVEVPCEEEDDEEKSLDVKPAHDTRCVLTAEHLAKDKMRVLTAMGGLFYAGHLNAVEPPDVYSITLDGERGNRPHIMSREEILRDAIVEVAPSDANELATGTRVCAYWSQQYRCLYPGTVAEPETPDPVLDSKFVSVEFDDGDSGRIAIEDIRYLPSDYPFVEYDPNPLLSLSKRKRRMSVNSVSTTETRRFSDCFSPAASSSCEPAHSTEHPTHKSNDKENEDKNKLSISSEEYHERKRLKKKKREKLKEKLAVEQAAASASMPNTSHQQPQHHEEKKKRKKCKCGDDHCKQRKKHHKKHHRKRRKHRRSEGELDDSSSSAAQTDQQKPPSDSSPTPPPDEEEITQNPEPVYENDATTTLSSEDNSTEPDDIIPAPADDSCEVTLDDVIDSKAKKLKKRDRQESSESRSKMTAFLHKKQLWRWAGKGYKRSKVKGRMRKEFFREIKRDKESISVGDSAVFLSTNSPDRPYIGKIQAMWESTGSMAVKVKWFYHPEETKGCPKLKYPGALFESPHEDENDVQTISHKCEVLPLKEFKERLGDDPKRYAAVYNNNDVYYLAGYYDPGARTLNIQSGIPSNDNHKQ